MTQKEYYLENISLESCAFGTDMNSNKEIQDQ